MLVQLILLVLATSVQVKSLVLIIFAQVNLFVLIMSAEEDLSVEVRFVRVKGLVVVIFIIEFVVQIIFVLLIHH